jgi:hypothetical protein
MEQTTRIYEEKGATTVWLDAIRRADGSLTIAGFDCGEAPMEAYGREDLEYELTIPAAEMPKVLTALLKALLAPSGTPITTLRACLDAGQVRHTFRFIP